MATATQSVLFRHQDQIDSLSQDFSLLINALSTIEVKLPKTTSGTTSAAPFIKWVGGKRSLLNQITKFIPKDFNDYYETFVGGGALFFHLSSRVKKAVLSDINIDLLIAYTIVKNNPDKLISSLTKHAKKHCQEYYNEIRRQHKISDPIEKASRFIYLNKTCYNGLFRVNKKGEFNVPMGSYTNPKILDVPNLRACSIALANTEIKFSKYDEITPSAGDLVYFDPPYHPTFDSAFTTYTKLDFSEHDQKRLCEFAIELTKKNVSVVLSNSSSNFIRKLYPKKYFQFHEVLAPRFVNCKPEKRGKVTELLITNI